MLKEIKLKNFKIFKEETSFPLAKINLLTGINGQGKSSLLQALLLMRQSVEQAPYSGAIFLNGSCVNLGTAEEVINDEQEKDANITIGFTYQLTVGVFEIQYILKKHISESKLLQISKIHLNTTEDFYFYFGEFEVGKELILKEIGNEKFIAEVVDSQRQEKEEEEDSQQQLEAFYRLEKLLPVNYSYGSMLLIHKSPLPISQISLHVDFQKIHYVSSARPAPKRYYEKESLSDFINVGGVTSDLTASVLSNKKTDLIDAQRSLSKDTQNLEQQTEAWLDYIFGNIKFKIDDSQTDIIYLLFKTKPEGEWQKPSNVGFGFSYILPIIVSGLIAKEGEILIIENPEAHLHPRAQSRLTEFLSKVASTGVQVFIESHSEHILNGLRIAAINQDIDITNEDISVLYFHEKEEGYFTQIPIKPDGKIEQWEEDFFDQAEKDIDILLGI